MMLTMHIVSNKSALMQCTTPTLFAYFLLLLQLLQLCSTMDFIDTPEELCPADGSTSRVDQQLVLYSPPKFLQPLLEREKRVVFAGREWVIEQNWDGVGIAAVIWEPALALCSYMESMKSDLILGQRVIELGAGTGLVGLVAHALGAATVVITDRNPQPAEQNLHLNSHHLDPQRPVITRKLEWGQEVSDFHPPYDVLLAADVVYIEETFPLLIQCMDMLSSAHTTILLSCKYRYERDSVFLDMMKERFVSKVVWSNGDLSIHSIRKRN